MRFIRTFGLAMTILTLMQASAIAGVIIGGTRIIFDGAKKESSISVNNPDPTPYLIQSWIDERDGGVGKTPLLLRLRCTVWIADKKILNELSRQVHCLKRKKACSG